MKKRFYLIALILGVVLLFSGCGKKHTLTCTYEGTTIKRSAEVVYNDDETEAKSATVETIYDYSSRKDKTEKDVKDYEEEAREQICSDKYDFCEVKAKGMVLTIRVKGSAEALDVPKGSLKEVKEILEGREFKCK